MPEYQSLQRIQVCAGSDDILSTPEDIELLTEALPAHAVLEHKQYHGLAHIDFTWGMHAHTTVYPDVLRMLKRMKRLAAR